jgi:tetraacyldisaccharide 4'-kinase
MISSLRSLVYRVGLRPSVRLPSFVVSVGNLSFGGTGKSPFVAALAEWCVRQGLRTAVLSRGYKRSSRELCVVPANQPLPGAEAVGDEPWMIRNRVPGISLLVHPDRAREAERHWSKLESPEIVILDDGFQHWRAARDRDVVMLDAAESLRQGSLPFGRLREPATALARADLVVITRAKALSAASLRELMAEVGRLARARAPAPWKHAYSPAVRIVAADYEFAGYLDARTGQDCDAPTENAFTLVTGIAKPAGLRALAASLELPVKEELVFPDHHRLSPGEEERVLAAASRGAALLSEKDWARWRGLFRPGGPPAYVLRVRFHFLGDGEGIVQDFFREVEKEARQCSISR